jgi:protein-tyrosine phosphatase
MKSMIKETKDPRRGLKINGTYNVRDLGGYPIEKGGYTRWQRFLRSESLFELDADAQLQLYDYGLRHIVDLRNPPELAERPNVFAESESVHYHHIQMQPEGPLKIEPKNDVSKGERLGQGYCAWLDHSHDRFAQIINVMADADDVVLFHCASGKDRTGMIAALLLGLAGVEDDIIVADYTLTAQFSIDNFLASFENPEILPPSKRPKKKMDPPANIKTWQDYEREICPAETMRYTLAHISDVYGGARGYMETIGMAPAKIDQLRNSMVA